MSRITARTFAHTISTISLDDHVFLPSITSTGRNHKTMGKRYTAHFDAYTDFESEVFLIIPSIPMTGIGYIVKEDGFTETLANTFSLRRLHNIRQLGFLQRPVYGKGEEIAIGYPLYFTQSRYQHVCDVQAILLLMLTNNSLTRSEYYTARAAALLHDTLTPAGGDTTKLLDPRVFDEDLHFPELLEKVVWNHVQEEFEINTDLLVETVQGKGALSQLLDIADKIAYTSRDYMNLLGLSAQRALPRNSPFRDLYRLTRQYRVIGNLWDSVSIHQQNIVFHDAFRLYRFLLLRALMFRHLYYSPGTRFQEFVIGKVILPYLYTQGILTKDNLLTMEDWQLEQTITRFLCDQGGYNMLSALDVYISVYKTGEEATEKERTLRNNGCTCVFVEHIASKTKSGIHYLVQHEGKIDRFDALFPQLTSVIQSHMAITQPFRVYWTDSNIQSSNFSKALSLYYESK